MYTAGWLPRLLARVLAASRTRLQCRVCGRQARTHARNNPVAQQLPTSQIVAAIKQATGARVRHRQAEGRARAGARTPAGSLLPLALWGLLVMQLSCS